MKFKKWWKRFGKWVLYWLVFWNVSFVLIRAVTGPDTPVIGYYYPPRLGFYLLQVLIASVGGAFVQMSISRSLRTRKASKSN